MESAGSANIRSHGGPERRVRQVLCPLDWTPDSRRALQYAAMLALTHDAQLTALHVGELVALYPAIVARVAPTMVPNPTRSERAARVSELLRDHAPGCRPADVLLAEGEIVSTILAAATRLPTDLIVMATHHPGPLRRWTRGSVAAGVVRSACCPVPGHSSERAAAGHPQHRADRHG